MGVNDVITGMIRTFANRFFLTLSICLFSTVFFAQTKSTNIQTIDGKQYYIHAIEKKQSLYSISKLYNVTLDVIYAVNPEAKGGTRAGQEIKIPVKTAKTTTPTTNTVAVKTPSTTVKTATAVSQLPDANAADTSRYYTYVVEKKETMYAITKKFNITEAELKILNPVLITQGLKEGQTIVVGEKPKRSVNTTTLTVKKDSVAVIRKPKKTAYTVALILPFRLDQTLALDLGP
ncbi:MAG: peptidoglycan-binding protein LysM, partial [Bacteroidetes bacterium]|nr:peptidoglycan-binding protein LysM [Bacteroidota bacterium]